MDEFVIFFKKQVSTESSPSGRHMGHYKVCASDEDVATLLNMKINVALCCGRSMKRLQQSINDMMEKEKRESQATSTQNNSTF